MIGDFEASEPSVGIFWMVGDGPAGSRLLAEGCAVTAAEPYGDFLTFADGHYEVWGRWRKARAESGALQGLVCSYEYEDWPRGRIVFDLANRRFILYADRKLLQPETLALIRKRFSIALEDSIVETDFHYQSRETPR